MEKDNRKSHLAPQLSPATQELLRSHDSPTYANMSSAGTVVGDPLQTPTSGEIPIAGGTGVITSPRDHYQHHQQQYQYAQHTQYSHMAPAQTRSPTRGLNSANGIGRAGPGLPAHPGAGQRVVTTNSIPTITSQMADMSINGGSAMSGPTSANAATFSLPMRSGPPGGPLPPPPPRKETPDELRRSEQSRRQATFGLPPNGSYSNMGAYHG